MHYWIVCNTAHIIFIKNEDANGSQINGLTISVWIVYEYSCWILHNGRLLFFSPQKFTGHATAVTTLCFATTRPPDGNGLYFLSGATDDRLLSVWWVEWSFFGGGEWISFSYNFVAILVHCTFISMLWKLIERHWFSSEVHLMEHRCFCFQHCSWTAWSHGPFVSYHCLHINIGS